MPAEFWADCPNAVSDAGFRVAGGRYGEWLPFCSRVRCWPGGECKVKVESNSSGPAGELISRRYQRVDGELQLP